MEDDLAARKGVGASKRTPRSASKHQLKVDKDELKAWMAERNIGNQADLAAFLDVGAATANRACQGQAIGQEFVSALGKKVPRERLGTFFICADNLPLAA